MKPAVRLYVIVASNLTALARACIETTDLILDRAWEWADE